MMSAESIPGRGDLTTFVVYASHSPSISDMSIFSVSTRYWMMREPLSVPAIIVPEKLCADL